MITIRANSKSIFLSLLLAISFLLMLISYYKPAQFLKIREKAYLLGDVFYALSFNSKKTVGELLASITDSKRIMHENELLTMELGRLSIMYELYYHEIDAANEKLRELLNFKEAAAFDLMPAEALAYSPDDFFKVLYINRGRKDGVVEEMPLINTTGLVGKVTEVYMNTAQVMLITDKRSKVGVRIQRTRDIGIMQGTGNPKNCDLHYILTKAEVEIGDTVVTSGLGEIFPREIKVGYVSFIEKKPNYVFQHIQITPAVDFGKLEELFLIVGKK